MRPRLPDTRIRNDKSGSDLLIFQKEGSDQIVWQKQPPDPEQVSHIHGHADFRGRCRLGGGSQPRCRLCAGTSGITPTSGSGSAREPTTGPVQPWRVRTHRPCLRYQAGRSRSPPYGLGRGRPPRRLCVLKRCPPSTRRAKHRFGGGKARIRA